MLKSSLSKLCNVSILAYDDSFSEASLGEKYTMYAIKYSITCIIVSLTTLQSFTSLIISFLLDQLGFSLILSVCWSLTKYLKSVCF